MASAMIRDNLARLLRRYTPAPSTTQRAQRHLHQCANASSNTLRHVFAPCQQRARIELLRRFPRSTQLRQLRYQAQTKRGRIYRAWKGYKLLYAENPVSMTVLTFVALPSLIFAMAWTQWYYFAYIIGNFSAFPEPVAAELRKALYFTNISLDVQRAQKHFIQAQRIAIEQEGMDPFSDALIGANIWYATLFEKALDFHKAIEVYEHIFGQNLQWLEHVGVREGWERQRSMVLERSIQVAVKLGELYAGPHVMERDLAEEKLTWAVKTMFEEMSRRKELGNDQEGPEWLSPEQLGATVERLAHMWEEKNLYHIAAPLFLRALDFCPKDHCHAAVLMNNLSISLAQQSAPVTPTASAAENRRTLISNARAWADKAIVVANKISGDGRTEECDVAVAVATHNLGEFAEMDNDLGQARAIYQRARRLSHDLSFKDGVTNADAALKRLDLKAKAA